jgi:hypothetical protein
MKNNSIPRVYLPKHREHDFSFKLRQQSVLPRLKTYFEWIRAYRKNENHADILEMAPVSINLDLTAACNFACPHCVDSGILNTGTRLETVSLRRSMDLLIRKGLLSVILIGGGEPTLHPDFEEIVRHLKKRGLQIGIVTNGANLHPVINVAPLLKKKDWVRISVDAASEKTFLQSHRPKQKITLEKILRNAMALKGKNPDILLGYSYVIIWDGIRVAGRPIPSNVHEMADAVIVAENYGFDYISFKPFLTRLPGSQKESLLTDSGDGRKIALVEHLHHGLDKAFKASSKGISIMESVNLTALLNGTVAHMKCQPKTCHMQAFNAVFTPTGIYRCPAFRGNQKAKIAGVQGCSTISNIQDTSRNLSESLKRFNAAEECSVIACFYHHVNWWLEKFTDSDQSVEIISPEEDDNFFL